VQAQKHLESLKPSAVVGFGGYATWPVLAAAATLKIPTAAHEQNAVLGRVNRWLSPVVDALALSYERTRFLTGSRARKAIVTGNPVRPEVAALAAMPYPAVSEDGIFRILVVGGSLGARVLSEVVPTALSMLPFAQRRRLQVTQQCRAEDLERVDALYREAGIAAETAEFLDDMPERLSWAHLVIARAGASTLAEVAAAGRPAILVPLPIATDDHQTENARSFAQAGAGWLVPQPEFTAADLAKRVQKLITRPEGLIEAAAAARTLGRPEATRLLSDLIERMARLKGTGRDLFAEPALAPTTLDDNTMQRRAA
jgi:UDP-N-acetylglucosamine--N-acetylmuramyl-(pentapeptide) pyrophosphoryl-undecaprenol N-acetylglucosamine transferase